MASLALVRGGIVGGVLPTQSKFPFRRLPRSRYTGETIEYC
jgi:hypothetical protein